MQHVTLPDGTKVPTLGQGTWRMGEDPGERQAEIAALQHGIDLGMTLIDTAEMYGEGGAEEVVGEAIAGRREQVFLVSKVYPQNASQSGTRAACQRSLKRLGVDRIDLYLLHWRGGARLEAFVTTAERLREQGLVGAWGVSNFDLDDLSDLDRIVGGNACATNQVLWNLEARGVEFDLLPALADRGMPMMAYSPIGQGGSLLRHPALVAVARRIGVTAAQVALAFVLSRPGVIAIPKASRKAHVKLNREALDLRLGEGELAALDAAFPPPLVKQPLEML